MSLTGNIAGGVSLTENRAGGVSLTENRAGGVSLTGNGRSNNEKMEFSVKNTIVSKT